MKKLTLFTLLILMTTACAKKNAGVDENEDFGLGGDPVLEGEIELPEETPPGGSTIPEDDDTEEEAPVVCEPVDITTTAFNEETLAGEDYYLDITTRNPCIYYACELASGPDWLTMNGCRLEGTPNTAESLGVHENIQVRVYDSTDNTNADVLGFTLTVYDEPEIVVYPSNAQACGSGKMKEGKSQKNASEEIGENEETIGLVRGRNILCLRVEGYARSYDDPVLNGENIEGLAIVDGENAQGERKVFQITFPDSAASYGPVDITAVDEHGNEAQKRIVLHVLMNPCDTLSIQPDENSEEGLVGGNPSLGHYYRICFEAIGGEGPFVWNHSATDQSNNFRVDGNSTFDEVWEAEDDDLEDNKYCLQTGFQIPGDLDWQNDNTLFHRLNLEVTAEGCWEEETNYVASRKDYNLPPPVETVGDIECQIDFTGLWDSNTRGEWKSTVSVVFLKEQGEERAALGGISYDIPFCREDEASEANCKSWREAAGLEEWDESSEFTGFVDEINTVALLFFDKAKWSTFGRDHDDLDFDLLSLNCQTPYRTFSFDDGPGGRFNDDVMGFSRGFWSRVGNFFLSLGGSLACINPVNWFVMEDHCFGYAWGQEWGTMLGRTVGDSYAKPASVGHNWFYRSKKLEVSNNYPLGVWQPRPRPDYSAGSTE